MIRAAIDKILQLAPIEKILLPDNRIVYTKELFEAPIESFPETIEIQTLSGVVDYCQNLKDEDEKGDLIVHILSPLVVRVCSKLYGEQKQRNEYLKAVFKRRSVEKHDRHELEGFLLFLRSRFADAGDRAILLEFLSKVDMSDQAIFQDDGVAQKVTVVKGIAGRELLQVPNPVTLLPYRTFPEIEQPEASYIVRLKKEMSPLVTLIEVDDGGAWEMVAISCIQDWLKKSLPEGTIILA